MDRPLGHWTLGNGYSPRPLDIAPLGKHTSLGFGLGASVTIMDIALGRHTSEGFGLGASVTMLSGLSMGDLHSCALRCLSVCLSVRARE